MAKKIIYDKEEDILSLSKGRKVKYSIDIGDFVIDIDHKGFVSGVEILNASENLNLKEKQLEEMKEASMKVDYKPDYIYIYLAIKLKNKEKDLTMPLAVDLGHRKLITKQTDFAKT